MRKPLISIATLSLLSLSSLAWAQQSLVPDDSEIKFTFRQLGVPVSGQFSRFEGDVQLDPAALDSSSLTLRVDTASASIGHAQTDAELVKAEWFDTAQFPFATFESSAIKSTGGDQYEATGTLTIKGESSDVTVPVTLENSGGRAVASGTLPIGRLQFNIGDGDWRDTSMVADEVQVNFKLAVDGVPTP